VRAGLTREWSTEHRQATKTTFDVVISIICTATDRKTVASGSRDDGKFLCHVPASSSANPVKRAATMPRMKSGAPQVRTQLGGTCAPLYYTAWRPVIVWFCPRSTIVTDIQKKQVTT